MVPVSAVASRNASSRPAGYRGCDALRVGAGPGATLAAPTR